MPPTSKSRPPQRVAAAWVLYAVPVLAALWPTLEGPVFVLEAALLGFMAWRLDLASPVLAVPPSRVARFWLSAMTVSAYSALRWVKSGSTPGDAIGAVLGVVAAAEFGLWLGAVAGSAGPRLEGLTATAKRTYRRAMRNVPESRHLQVRMFWGAIRCDFRSLVLLSVTGRLLVLPAYGLGAGAALLGALDAHPWTPLVLVGTAGSLELQRWIRRRSRQQRPARTMLDTFQSALTRSIRSPLHAIALMEVLVLGVFGSTFVAGLAQGIAWMTLDRPVVLLAAVGTALALVGCAAVVLHTALTLVLDLLEKPVFRPLRAPWLHHGLVLAFFLFAACATDCSHLGWLALPLQADLVLRQAVAGGFGILLAVAFLVDFVTSRPTPRRERDVAAMRLQTLAWLAGLFLVVSGPLAALVQTLALAGLGGLVAIVKGGMPAFDAGDKKRLRAWFGAFIAFTASLGVLFMVGGAPALGTASLLLAAAILPLFVLQDNRAKARWRWMGMGSFERGADLETLAIPVVLHTPKARPGNPFWGRRGRAGMNGRTRKSPGT